ncbi:polysaccharide deacetylase family protein, partial [candidate division KSB3 bacterium]|nr:polysaccharide deacetylase family protein [candidate division KSB3 bacterium]MBD3323898.1 polysaccharide deacetylase family protein [candidate division KSB3 bacterium]
MKTPDLARIMLRNLLILTSGSIRLIAGKAIGKRVLCLHEITDADRFRSKMAWLKEHYKVVSLAELLHRSDVGNGMVALTFDDGYASWHDVAAAVLEAFDLPATFFVCSGFVGLQGAQAQQFVTTCLRRQQVLTPLTKAQLSELASHPLFEIGGHTAHHPDLGRNLEQPVLEREILDDRSQLQEWTGTPVRWFAYPFGMSAHISDGAIQILESAQFAGACTLIPQFVTEKTPRLLIGRDGLALEA